jgi:hypothetical protein
MYLLGKKLSGPSGGLLAALVYVYLPFHLATVYVRGAFAEAWAFALYPLVLLCWAEYGERRSPLWAGAAVLAFVALSSTHLGLAVLFAFFLLAFVLVFGPSRRAKGEGLLLIVISLPIGILVNLPAALAEGFSVRGRPDFAEHFVYPFQLLSESWGYGVSVPGWDDGLPLQLGLAAAGLTALTGLLALGQRDTSHGPRVRAGFFVVAALVMVLLVMHPAAGLWRISGLFWTLDYPWQLLGLVGFATSLASGGVLLLAPTLRRLPWLSVLITLVVLASYGYLSPRFTELRVGGSPVGVFGDEVVLLSYQREGPLRHGATVRLTLDWQSLRPMVTDHTVFVHVVDEEGTIWAQHDGEPVDGERPTSSWSLGEIVHDEYQIMIPVGGPREGYRVQAGLYDGETGVRLTVSDGATAVTLE